MTTRDDVFRVVAEITAISLPEIPQPKPRKDEADFGLKELELQKIAKEIGPITLTKVQEQERKSLRVSMPRRLDAQLV